MTGDGGRPPWPAWFGPAAFAGALAFVLLLIAPLGDVVGADSENPPPAFTLGATLIQDAALLAAALLLARTVAKPRWSHFGLVRVPFRSALGWTALGGATFYLVSAAYAVIVRPDGEQTVVQDLGADESTLLLIAASILVVGIAPFVEEIFFRGFFYGALRTRFGTWAAALMNGALFGAIHYSGPGTLEILPPLALLGVIFCLLYERTGSLYSAIALHVFNNSVALAAATKSALPLAAGAVALCVCAGLAGRSQPRAAPA